MKIAHQKRNRDVTTKVFRVLRDDGTYCYRLRQNVGTGRGPANPSISADFSPSEMRSFCEDLIGMIAVEEARS